MNSRAPSLSGHYSASSLLRTHPPPSRLQPLSRCFRLYGLPCSGDFSPGRGGFLQLLGTPLSPCRRYHPAGGTQRISLLRRVLQSSLQTYKLDLRILISRLRHVRCRYSLVTRDHPFDGLVGRLQGLGLPPPCYPSYGVPTFTPVGLTPTECASLRWTHGPARCSLSLRPARCASLLTEGFS